MVLYDLVSQPACDSVDQRKACGEMRNVRLVFRSIVRLAPVLVDGAPELVRSPQSGKGKVAMQTRPCRVTVPVSTLRSLKQSDSDITISFLTCVQYSALVQYRMRRAKIETDRMWADEFKCGDTAQVHGSDKPTKHWTARGIGKPVNHKVRESAKADAIP